MINVHTVHKEPVLSLSKREGKIGRKIFEKKKRGTGSGNADGKPSMIHSRRGFGGAPESKGESNQERDAQTGGRAMQYQVLASYTGESKN